MNQNQQYEMAGITDQNHFDNSFRGLSKKEQKLKKALSETKGETLVAISIRERLSGGSVRNFRDMVAEFKQQYDDCGRERMIEVLGIDAVKLLEAL